ncbi:MAG: acyl-ACP--UDP-N-acetylglucosamine O-acyltransferase [Xanthomonadaceae bacterium]|nr:acyl-ACP--UDP-N-acetylglucosamine O-acyltransferase [Xanthomonadaceae bacterium]
MIHSTAIIEKGAELDSGVEVGPYCIIGPKVKIGTGTRLMSHVVVSGKTSIGKSNTFFPFSVIGGVPQDLKYNGENTELRIGDRNTIRESVTLNLGTAQGSEVTVVGNDNLLMAYVHLGHDTSIGDHCIIANSVQIAGHVTLEDYVTIGGVSAIAQFLKMGKHSYVSGHTGVEKSVPPFCIAHGSRPMTLRGANIVGLRRRGYKAEVIQMLNETIKLWTRTDVNKDQTLIEIESQYGEAPEVQEFVRFIRDCDTGVVR